MIKEIKIKKEVAMLVNKKSYLTPCCDSPMEGGLNASFADKSSERLLQKQHKTDNISISNDARILSKIMSNQQNSTNEDWTPELDSRVTAWIKENWEYYRRDIQNTVVKLASKK